MLSAQKVSTGAFHVDDFDGEELSSLWVSMQHREIKPKVEGGHLVIEGVPSTDARPAWHAGAMTDTAINAGLPDAVMSGEYILPDWQYDTCTLDWKEFPIYEFHMCNHQPDRNHSIRISRLCPTSAAQKATFAGLTEEQLPERQIREDGVKMLVSYRGGVAEGRIVTSDGKATLVTTPRAVLLEDHKRMELKSIVAPIGVNVNLRVKWAALYPHPATQPVHIQAEGTSLEIVIGDWSEVVSIVNGVASLYLPDDRLYPSNALIEVSDDSGPTGLAVIPHGLGALYPGDVWKLEKITPI